MVPSDSVAAPCQDCLLTSSEKENTASPTRRPANDGAVQPLDRHDPRLTQPLLTVREVAWGLGLSVSTFRSWARGYEKTRKGGRPVVGKQIVTYVAGRHGEASVPFIGIAEALVLAAFRRTGVPLQRIRPALDELAREIGIAHALASRSLYSDGAEVLYDYAERRDDPSVADELTVVRSGQRVFRDIVSDYLRLISYGRDGWPEVVRLPEFGRAVVVVDPKRAFGRPLFESGGARVEDVLDRWRAGDSFVALSQDFGVPSEEIEDAARAAATRAAA